MSRIRVCEPVPLCDDVIRCLTHNHTLCLAYLINFLLCTCRVHSTACFCILWNTTIFQFIIMYPVQCCFFFFAVLYYSETYDIITRQYYDIVIIKYDIILNAKVILKKIKQLNALLK